MSKNESSELKWEMLELREVLALEQQIRFSTTCKDLGGGGGEMNQLPANRDWIRWKDSFFYESSAKDAERVIRQSDTVADTKIIKEGGKYYVYVKLGK